MFKKKIIFLFLPIFVILTSCGYTPQYAKNKNLDFSVELINLSGDRDFNNSFKSRLSNYFNKEKAKNKNFKISANSKYEKNVTQKNSAGTATEYELKIKVRFQISSGETQRELKLKEIFIMKKIDDSFEESNYERTIKNNFADIIKEELIFYLLQIK